MVHLHDHKQRDALERRASRICAELGLQPRSTKTKVVTKSRQPRQNRTADRIDGYDRDDLGQSPDF